MKNFSFRMALSALCLLSFAAAFTRVEAGPVRFDQVVQVMNARPGTAGNGNFSRLSVANYYNGFVVGDDDDDKKKPQQPQDGRVITETTTDIVEDEVCDCVKEDIITRGFPKWALLGFAGVPVGLILINKKPTPTPTETLPPPPPPPPPPPTATPTPTPTATPTPPPPPPPPTVTPTPPQAVPEPMTILLFGTGLASIGLAARRRFGKKDKSADDE